MITKYRNAHFVDTSEAYSDKLFIGNNHNLTIPYIAIDLMSQNPITGKRAIINYSYYLFTGVKSVQFKGDKNCMLIEFYSSQHQAQIAEEHIMVGGYRSYGGEVVVDCNETFLFVPDYAKFGDYPCPFVPKDTPNFPRNMSTEEVESFFSISTLPDEVKGILGEKIYSISW